MLEAPGKRVLKIESANAVFCVLEAERGYEMQRSTCPDGQFWLHTNGTWTIQREDQHLAGKTLTYYAPREKCRRVSETDTCSLGIQIKGPLLRQVLSEEERRLFQIDFSIQRSILKIAHTWRSGDLDPDSLEVLAVNIPIDFSRTYQAKEGDLRWVRAIRDQIADQLDKPLNLKQLADDNHLSPAHLSAAFSKRHGLTISAFRQQLRLQRTIDYAVRSRESLYDAAIACGFYDASHLYRVVKKELGLTPAELQAVMGHKSKFRTRFKS